MDEVKEEVQTGKKEKVQNNTSNFGVTLLFVTLAVIVGFAVLLCM